VWHYSFIAAEVFFIGGILQHYIILPTFPFEIVFFCL